MTSSPEIAMPAADPKDPYAMPALMPSSADRAIRSFDYADFDIPTRKQEDFRYTPVERVEEFFQPFASSDDVTATVGMIDGSALPDTVTVRTASKEETGVPAVGEPADRIEAIEWAAAPSELVIDIRADTPTPVLVDVSGHGLDLAALHIVIVARPHVRADVVIEHTGSARLAEGVEVTAMQGSELSVTSVQEWNDDSKHVGGHRLRIGAEATLRHSVVTLGGDVVRLRMDQDFDGPHAKSDMLGIYFVGAGKHYEHRTMVVHNHPECMSRVIYKGALSGEHAHSTWVGNALIEPTAPGTDSYELNRNLVLTKGAIADSEPNLEIENGNIVGAGHASSVGRFDEEQLFYMESRGVPERQARKLVVHGFFKELVDQVGIPQIDDRIMATLDARLDESVAAPIAEKADDGTANNNENYAHNQEEN